MADTTFFSTDSSASQDTQLDKASAPGLVGDDHEHEGAEADAPSTAPDALHDDEHVDPKEIDEGALSGSETVSESASSSTAEPSHEEPAAPTKKPESDATTPGIDTKPSSPSQTPTQSGPDEFSELQGDVSELAQHLENDAIEALKKAGNAVTPAVGKLHGIEEKLEGMGDELKNRFVHVKTQLVNAMGALERLFKRGK